MARFGTISVVKRTNSLLALNVRIESKLYEGIWLDDAFWIDGASSWSSVRLGPFLNGLMCFGAFSGSFGYSAGCDVTALLPVRSLSWYFAMSLLCSAI